MIEVTPHFKADRPSKIGRFGRITRAPSGLTVRIGGVD
jgi:hypothetical protein